MIFLKYKERRPGTLVYPTRCVQNENEPSTSAGRAISELRGPLAK
jgi:hypothetical protein